VTCPMDGDRLRFDRAAGSPIVCGNPRCTEFE
jgi:hypothetical protein